MEIGLQNYGKLLYKNAEEWTLDIIWLQEKTPGSGLLTNPKSKSQEPCFDFPTLIHVLQLSNHKKTKNQKPKFQNSFPGVFGRVILIRRKRRNERLKKHRGW
jgi:hypothetical protein